MKVIITKNYGDMYDIYMGNYLIYGTSIPLTLAYTLAWQIAKDYTSHQPCELIIDM